MAYRTGDIYVETLADYINDYGLDDGENVHVSDSRALLGTKHPVIKLPHSRDAWVVGSVENVRAMIADLQNALKQMEQE